MIPTPMISTMEALRLGLTPDESFSDLSNQEVKERAWQLNNLRWDASVISDTRPSFTPDELEGFHQKANEIANYVAMLEQEKRDCALPYRTGDATLPSLPPSPASPSATRPTDSPAPPAVATEGLQGHHVPAQPTKDEPTRTAPPVEKSNPKEKHFRRGELDDKAHQLLSLDPGMTNQAIADRLGCTPKPCRTVS